MRVDESPRLRPELKRSDRCAVKISGLPAALVDSALGEAAALLDDEGEPTPLQVQRISSTVSVVRMDTAGDQRRCLELLDAIVQGLRRLPAGEGKVELSPESDLAGGSHHEFLDSVGEVMTLAVVPAVPYRGWLSEESEASGIDAPFTEACVAWLAEAESDVRHSLTPTISARVDIDEANALLRSQSLRPCNQTTQIVAGDTERGRSACLVDGAVAYLSIWGCSAVAALSSLERLLDSLEEPFSATAVQVDSLRSSVESAVLPNGERLQTVIVRPAEGILYPSCLMVVPPTIAERADYLEVVKSHESIPTIRGRRVVVPGAPPLGGDAPSARFLEELLAFCTRTNGG